jgi:monooxygenase
MMPEHVDVVIVGAGLSGIGAARHLQTSCPDRTYVIFEGRDAIGGTWDLFRYPGIRSDSDMYTLGYAFKPWREARAIADGQSILKYVRDTATEGDVERHIRFGSKVKRATWSSETAAWTVEVERGGETATVSCSFLFLCGGYYSYDGGYTPEFPGIADFKGAVVHPQAWPKDLDYSGKRVVVIGSGATAVTLAPEMAKTAAHVTMLQRSPTYMVSRPAEDKLANTLRRWLPGMLAYNLIRARNVLGGMYFFNLCRTKPAQIRDFLLKPLRERFGEAYVERHFTPRYNPWDQRLCLVPDDDFFQAIDAGKASVVTDEISTFTEAGIQLVSGETLPADVVVTATGLVLEVWNGIEIAVDGRRIEAADTLAYKGMLYEGVPNLASSFGYTNASWTLKCDLTCEYVCRILNHMKATGRTIATPVNDDLSVGQELWLDFTSGYVQRAMAKFPKQGTKAPWRLDQNYAKDLMNLRYARLEDGVLRFTRPAAAASAKQAA